MGKYRIAKNVSYMDGKKVVLNRRVGEVFEIDDAVAKKLGSKVEAVGGGSSDSPKGSQEK